MLTRPFLRLAIPASLVIALALPVSPIFADVPHQISYQGLLLDDTGTPVPDGPYDITFTLYDQASGGNALWSSGVQMVQVTSGLFTHSLGSGVPIPDSVFSSGSNRYLGTQVDNDPELVPRTQLLSTAYALQARGAEMAHVFRLVPQDTPGPCDAAGRGEMYFDSVMNEPCFCEGAAWVQLDGGGPCECPDQDGDGFDICDPAHPKDNDNQPADCDDTDFSINPGQAEVACDGIDQDCDGVDEGAQDFDGDNTSVCAGDCDDFDPSINPMASEFCNGADDDCNGTVDDNALDAQPWYADTDNDGYGDAANSVQACVAPPGHIPDNTDCNDINFTIHPGAPEVCDGQDNDCDGMVDEGVGTTWYRDADGDGFGASGVTLVQCFQPPGYVANQMDCDDADLTVHPGAPEICDGTDNNCNGQTDENPVNGTQWWRDLDGDGYGANTFVVACSPPSGYVGNNFDCNDSNASINPAASEVCANGIDDDCDGQVDEGC